MSATPLYRRGGPPAVATSTIYKWLVVSTFFWLCVLAAVTVRAQVSGTAAVVLNYTLPVKNTDGTDIPTSGPNALAKVQVFLSNSTISDNDSTLQPTLETTLGSSVTVPSFTTSIGSTLHARLRVCNAAGACGPMTAEVTAIVTAKTPGSAILNTVTVTIK